MSLPEPTVQPARLRGLLLELLAVYSPSGKEGQALGCAADFLESNGLVVERQELDEWRHNLVVLPAEGEPELLCVGHIDTVPAFDMETLEPEVDEEEGTVTALGAADMKGGCAALMEAFVAAREAGLAPPAALALVVGEEEEGDGTQRLLEDLHAPWALVAEPTGLAPCLSHFGYIEAELNTVGWRRHAAEADPAHNAVRSMLRLLSALTAHFEERRNEVIYNIRDMHSSDSGFAVPDSCSACVDLHLPPHSPLGEIMAEIEAIAARVVPEPAEEVQTLVFSAIHSGYDLPESGPLAERLEAVVTARGRPWRPGAFRSHSDANLLWSAGIRPVIFGPGSLAEAHTRTESVPLAEVEEAARTVSALLAAFASGE